MDWSDSWHDAFRIELRAEAIGLAWRGWPVLPGTYPAGSRWADGESADSIDGVDAKGPVPVQRDWRDRIGTKPNQVATWWSGRPYSLLVATGVVLDAIEVSAGIGRRTAAVLRSTGIPVPIVATPARRWLFLTESGGQHAALRPHDDITVHGADSWVPLPPSPFRQGVAHWRVKPEVCGWRLPKADVVCNAIVRAIDVPSAIPIAGHADRSPEIERLSA
ncbi:MAG: bifunctional DNA primase/polymerase [Sciscionella sp.]|nr:bifunctional DNA primase/polymerase [Sciscionella sp.]